MDMGYTNALNIGWQHQESLVILSTCYIWLKKFEVVNIRKNKLVWSFSNDF